MGYVDQTMYFQEQSIVDSQDALKMPLELEENLKCSK